MQKRFLLSASLAVLTIAAAWGRSGTPVAQAKPAASEVVDWQGAVVPNLLQIEIVRPDGTPASHISITESLTYHCFTADKDGRISYSLPTTLSPFLYLYALDPKFGLAATIPIRDIEDCLEVQLKPSESLRGHVVDTAGNPIENATVEDTFYTTITRTDSQGRFTMHFTEQPIRDLNGKVTGFSRPIHPRDSLLIRDMRGNRAALTQIGDTRDFHITLEPAVTVMGTLMHPDGYPMPWVRHYIHQQDKELAYGMPVLLHATHETGQFVLPSMPLRDLYILHVWSKNELFDCMIRLERDDVTPGIINLGHLKVSYNPTPAGRLARTKEAYASLYRDESRASHETIRDILMDADQAGRDWFRHELIRRYETEPDPRLRANTLMYLLAFPNQEVAYPTLIKAIASDSEPGICRVALYRLGRIGGAHDIAKIMQFITEHGMSSELGLTAIDSIGEIGRRHKRAVPALKKLLSQQDLSEYTQIRIINALGSAADPNCYPIIENAIKQENSSLRIAGLNAIGPLVRQFESNLEVARKALKLIRLCTNDTDHRVVNRAILVLGYVGGNEDMRFVEKYLSKNRASLKNCPENSEDRKKYSDSVAVADRALGYLRQRLVPIEKAGLRMVPWWIGSRELYYIE